MEAFIIILCLINNFFVVYTDAHFRSKGCDGNVDGYRQLFKRGAPTPRVMRGNFGVTVSKWVNHQVSYTYYFDYNYLPSQNWTVKVCVRSSKATVDYPLLISIRQSMSVRSLHLPFTFHMSHYNYTYACYPLCPLGNVFPNIKAGTQTVEVELSSRSVTLLPFDLLVSNVTQYTIETNHQVSINITALEPSIMEYTLPDGVESVLVQAVSDNRLCMAVAVQDVKCPFYYSDRKLEYRGYYETATYQAGISVLRSTFKRGKMYIIIMLRPTDKDCTGSYDTNPEPFRRKEVKLIVTPQISGSTVGYVIFFTILIYAAFFALTMIIFETERCISSRKHSAPNRNPGDENEELLPVPSTSDDDDVDGSASSETVALIVPENYAAEEEERLKEKERFHQEMKTYPSYLIIICIFYGLPVVQLVLLNQKIVRLTGDQDMCYYNFLCSRSVGIFMDFNHVFSNIGYLILGFLFLLMVWRKKSFDEADKKKPENYARTRTRWITATFANKKDDGEEGDAQFEERGDLKSYMTKHLNYYVQSKYSTSNCDGEKLEVFFIKRCDVQKVKQLPLEEFRFVSASPVLPITVTFARRDRKKLVEQDKDRLSSAMFDKLGYYATVRIDTNKLLVHFSYIRSQDLEKVVENPLELEESFENGVDETIEFEFISSSLSEPPGLPSSTGLYYALGVALIMEAFCSGFYHICPNQANFQFDTTFMYVISVLGMSKLYYGRHPKSVPRSSVILWLFMAIAIFLVILSFIEEIAEHATLAWVFYTIVHGTVTIYIAHRLYFLSTGSLRWKKIVDACCHCPEKTIEYCSKIRDHPGRAIVTWLVVIGNIFWDIFRPEDISFVLFQLTLFIINFLVYVAFYFVMKICYKEKIHWKKIIVLIAFCMIWIPALVFFFTVKTEWQKSPAESREKNGQCMIADFYDVHDMWHFLSSFALFFSFLLILYLDEGIKDVPFEQIKKI